MRRRKLVFLLIVFIVPATAVALSIRKPAEYSASAQVLLKTGPQSQPGAPQTQADLARVGDVLGAVTNQVPGAHLTPAMLAKASSVTNPPGTDLLVFSVQSSNPRLAMQLATAYADSFKAYKLRKHILPRAEVVERASQAVKVGPRTVRNAVLALFLGVTLALIVVFLSDAADTRVRSAETIREALGLRLLGELPPPPSRLAKRAALVMLAEPTSHEAEPFRILRVGLEFANSEHDARSIMFTSAGDGEGKTTTSANLAVALARAGRRVVLIDADLRRPNLHNVFGLEARPGLADVELGEVTLAQAMRPIQVADTPSTIDTARRTSMRNNGSLEVLTAGLALPDPDELGAERALGRIVQRVRERADVVLIDAAPLLVGDAIALSGHVDAVVLVARLSALRKSTLANLGRILESSPAAKLGFVLTGAEKSEGYARYASQAPSESRSASVVQLTSSTAARNGNHDDGPAVPSNGSSEDARQVQRERARDT